MTALDDLSWIESQLLDTPRGKAAVERIRAALTEKEPDDRHPDWEKFEVEIENMCVDSKPETSDVEVREAVYIATRALNEAERCEYDASYNVTLGYKLHLTHTEIAAMKECVTAASRQPEREWQPIETAPRDGTVIIIYDGLHLREARYISITDPKNGEDFSYWASKRSHNGLCSYPTRWMPLPQPPKEKE